MSGLLCGSVAFNLAFLLDPSTEVALIVVSLGIGVGIVVWNLKHPSLRTNIGALSVYKRAAFVLFAPIMFAFMSAGNIYMALYAAHTAIAQTAQTVFTVSFKGTDLDLPGRCKYYVRFKDVPFFYLRKACVTSEAFDHIVRGSRLTVLGSRSPFGFRAETLKVLQANPTAGTDARKSAARVSP